MNAVIYARYSSHNQTEQSIEGQLRDCYAFAKRHDLTVIGEYIDRAISGRTDDRPDFQRMIADASKKQFERIIVWRLDRFSRNVYDSAIYRHKLQQYGVKVISAMENIGEGPESVILEAMLQGIAEYYSRELSSKVKRGRRESFIKGQYLGGGVPLGYKIVDKHYVIDEQIAPYVRGAFERYADGDTANSITSYLKSHGVKSWRGSDIQPSSLSAIFRNEKYTGRVVFDGETYDDYIPAIIDADLFARAAARAYKNRKAPAASRAPDRYLLQGKIFCGMCGTPMIGESGKSHNGTKYQYYVCGKRRKKHACKKRNESKGYIEWYVVEQTVQYVLDPVRIDLISNAVAEVYRKEFDQSQIKTLERQIKKCESDMSNAVDALIQAPAGRAREALAKKMEEIDARQTALEEDLAKLRIASKSILTEDDVKKWLLKFCKGDPLDDAFRERIIDAFVNSVYLYDDKVIIYYNIRSGKQVSFIDLPNTDVLEHLTPDGPGLKGSDFKRRGRPEMLKSELCTYIVTSGVFGCIFPLKRDR